MLHATIRNARDLEMVLDSYFDNNEVLDSEFTITGKFSRTITLYLKDIDIQIRTLKSTCEKVWANGKYYITCEGIDICGDPVMAWKKGNKRYDNQSGRYFE
jgi:hypothetical protein